MIPVSLIAIPLLCGLISFFIRSEGTARIWSFGSSVLTLLVAISGFTMLRANSGDLSFEAEWMPLLGSSFTLGIDGMGKILCLLTAVSFPVIFASTWRRSY